jgi:hypothetical protein
LNHVQRESWRDGDFGGTFGPRTPVRHVARTPVSNPRVRSVDVEELEGDRRRCLAMLRRLAGLWEERSGVTWRSSAAIKGCGTRRLSVAIKGNQVQSMEIKGNQGAIQCNQGAIQCNQGSSREIKGAQGKSRELKRQSRDSRLSVALDHCGTHYQGHTTKGTQ